MIGEINQFLLSTFLIERALTAAMLFIEAMVIDSALRPMLKKWSLLRYGLDFLIAFASVAFLGVELPVAQFSNLQPAWIALSFNVLVLAGVMRTWSGLFSKIELNMNRSSNPDSKKEELTKLMPHLNMSELKNYSAPSLLEKNSYPKNENLAHTQNNSKWGGFQLGNLCITRSK